MCLDIYTIEAVFLIWGPGASGSDTGQWWDSAPNLQQDQPLRMSKIDFEKQS